MKERKRESERKVRVSERARSRIHQLLDRYPSTFWKLLDRFTAVFQKKLAGYPQNNLTTTFQKIS